MEIQIQKAMEHLTSGRTSFIIAHRLSTIRNANIALFMQNGAIAKQGAHEELIRKTAITQAYIIANLNK